MANRLRFVPVPEPARRIPTHERLTQLRADIYIAAIAILCALACFALIRG